MRRAEKDVHEPDRQKRPGDFRRKARATYRLTEKLWQLFEAAAAARTAGQAPLFFSRTRLRARKNRTAGDKIIIQALAASTINTESLGISSLSENMGMFPSISESGKGTRQNNQYEVWECSPFLKTGRGYLALYLTSSSFAFLIRTDNQIDQHAEHDHSHHGAHAEGGVAGEQAADLDRRSGWRRKRSRTPSRWPPRSTSRCSSRA